MTLCEGVIDEIGNVCSKLYIIQFMAYAHYNKNNKRLPSSFCFKFIHLAFSISINNYGNLLVYIVLYRLDVAPIANRDIK